MLILWNHDTRGSSLGTLHYRKSSIQAELDKIVEELEVTKKELDSKHQKHNRKVCVQFDNSHITRQCACDMCACTQ